MSSRTAHYAAYSHARHSSPEPPPELSLGQTVVHGVGFLVPHGADAAQSASGDDEHHVVHPHNVRFVDVDLGVLEQAKRPVT